jgi:hypothetical protein
MQIVIWEKLGKNQLNPIHHCVHSHNNKAFQINLGLQKTASIQTTKVKVVLNFSYFNWALWNTQNWLYNYKFNVKENIRIR